MRPPCRCGSLRNPRGTCRHCDRPSKCTTRCQYCIQLKCRCYVCDTQHTTPAQAGKCEIDCRRLERKARR